MKVNELSREQLKELKAFHLSQFHDNISYYDLINIDNIVSDNEIMLEYDDINFSKDDFFVSVEL